jgi:hypothetical protein
MRLSTYLPLLTLTLPLTLAIALPPKGHPCAVDTHRCDSNALQVCTADGIFETTTQCAATESCFANDKFLNGGGCVPCSSNNTIHSPRERCALPDTDRCAFDPARTQRCTGGSWTDTQTCDPGSTCWADDDFLPGPRCARCVQLPAPEANDYCATPGFQTCDANLYSLLTCSPQHTWATAKKCVAPGDCKMDGAAQAHCEHGGMDPPRRRELGGCELSLCLLCTMDANDATVSRV